ncbi:Major facilitator superfamily domain, general substrate transporter [Penicillium griseofulvum]|uniref:Major facilitator superfamily domain, general substrate transporter n=1 Tax=Penicillium patulum TaxID=5078 RepID=A0A135LSL5_PENPA|nr:Major facilitator superfamily domain, general substrate transporter [Penicillium griseofulvum]KXG51926.1 Major facilitator superfamily domain, general substrate transporter [Penicillium griseofulvum]
MSEQPQSDLHSEKQTSDEESQSPSAPNDVKSPAAPGLGWKFWVLFVTLCLSGFAVTMEGSIVVTALPTIARDLHTTNYVWVVNCYTLASAIFQPLVGWLAEAFGRKPLMLGSIMVFAVGSAMAGAANSLGLILAGRLIQGIGGGAIPLIAELIICDLVPLEQRPQMLGMVMATSCLGLVFGPIIGGVIVNHSTWRWIFFLNLPLAGVSLLCLFPVLGHRTSEQRRAATSLRATARRVDWVGNTLLPASSVAILLPLTMGGKMYPWDSARVITPLVLGFCGLVGFGVYEHYCPNPLIPLRLLSNGSAVSLQIQSLIQSMLIMWINYFLTIYFQAVLGVSPQQAGFDLMPTIVAMVVFSIVGGIAMSKLPPSWAVLNNMIAFVIMSIGLGCFTILTPSSVTAVHVVLQIIVAGGNGLLLATLLPNVQGQFDSEDMTAVTALFNFLRSFALVWGMTIPSIIFNQSVDRNLGLVPQELRPLLEGGGAYVRASNNFMQSFHGTTKEQILDLYELALRDTWWGAMAFALLGLLLVALQRPGKSSAPPAEDTQQTEGKKESAEA